MDALTKLPREVQLILGGAVLYVIFSFFDWQQVSFAGISAGRTEWTGIGIIAALLAIVLLLWEASRAFEMKIQLGSFTPGLISAALALLLLVFTVITFLTHNEARHWPSWIGLILSIGIAAIAFQRAKVEGVEIPDMSAMSARMSTSGGSAAATPPAAPPAPTETDAGSDSPPDSGGSSSV